MLFTPIMSLSVATPNRLIDCTRCFGMENVLLIAIFALALFFIFKRGGG